MRHVAIICNPVSDSEKTRQVGKDITSVLESRGVSYAFYSTEWPKEWSGVTDAWIVGGDGTLNKFINVYPEIDIPIAAFKGGSANDFSWMLYGDISTTVLVHRVLSATARAVDAGDCNGNLFINGAGIGFDGAIVKDLIGKKKQGGKASYLFSVLRHMAYYSEKHCTIDFNDQHIEQDCFMISAANGKRYGGGFSVAPNASLDDGFLNVNIVGKISALKRMKYLPVIEKGAHLDLPFIKHYTSREVEISSSSVLPAHLDGEYLSSDHFIIKCLPKRFLFSY